SRRAQSRRRRAASRGRSGRSAAGAGRRRHSSAHRRTATDDAAGGLRGAPRTRALDPGHERGVLGLHQRLDRLVAVVLPQVGIDLRLALAGAAGLDPELLDLLVVDRAGETARLWEEFALLAHFLRLVNRRLELPLQVSRRLLAGSRVIVAWLADGLRAAVGAARDLVAFDGLPARHERRRILPPPQGLDPRARVARILLNPDAHAVGVLKPGDPPLVPRLERDPHSLAAAHDGIRGRRLFRIVPRHAV